MTTFQAHLMRMLLLVPTVLLVWFLVEVDPKVYLIETVDNPRPNNNYLDLAAVLKNVKTDKKIKSKTKLNFDYDYGFPEPQEQIVITYGDPGTQEPVVINMTGRGPQNQNF